MKKSGINHFFIIFTAILLLSSCSNEAATLPIPTSTQKPTRTPRPTRTPTPTIENTPEPTTTPISEGISETDFEDVTVKFWHPWTNNKEFTILSLVNEFNAKNDYGIVVTAISQGSDLYNNVRGAIGAPSFPQIVAGYNNQLQSWDNNGAKILDLDDYVTDPNWGLNPISQADFYPIFWVQDSNESKRLGLPIFRTTVVIFYNQSWAQELGFEEPPQTGEELKEQACAASAVNNDSTGGLIATTDIATNMSWLYAFEGGLLHPDGQQYQADMAENEAAFNFLRELLDAGCAWIPDANYPNLEFATRKGLFYPSSIAGIPFQFNAFEEANNFDQWTVLPFPSVSHNPVINVYGPAYAIFESTPKEQLASWIFIKWLLEPQNQAQLIEVSGYLPASSSAFAFLDEYADENPLWAKTVDMIPYGKIEPSLSSWGIARWAFGDAIKDLFSPDFTPEQIPLLLVKLEETLNETHLNNP